MHATPHLGAHATTAAAAFPLGGRRFLLCWIQWMGSYGAESLPVYYLDAPGEGIVFICQDA